MGFDTNAAGVGAIAGGAVGLVTGGLLGGLLGGSDPMAEARKVEARERADAQKFEAKEQAQTRKFEAQKYAEAKEVEAKERSEARQVEAKESAEARRVEAKEGADARRTVAIERADTAKHLSDNELREEKDQNLTARFAIMTNSKDFIFKVMSDASEKSEYFDTKVRIAFKDAEVRLAQIRSDEKIEQGNNKVDERELDVRAIEALRGGSVGTDGMFA